MVGPNSFGPVPIPSRAAHSRPSFPRSPRPRRWIGLDAQINVPALARARPLSVPLTGGPARSRRLRPGLLPRASARVRHGLPLALVRQKGKRPRFFARMSPSRSPILPGLIQTILNFKFRLYPVFPASSFRAVGSPPPARRLELALRL